MRREMPRTLLPNSDARQNPFTELPHCPLSRDNGVDAQTRSERERPAEFEY